MRKHTKKFYETKFDPDNIFTDNDKKYIPEEGEVFKQVFTASKSAKYWRVRQSLPKYWFISNFGTLVSVKKSKSNVLKGTISGYNRIQHDLTVGTKKKHRYLLAPETIVALTFEANCTEKALECINRMGVRCLDHNQKDRRSIVEVHHINNYVYADTKDGTRKNRKINCKLDNLAIYRNDEHSVLTKLSISNEDNALDSFIEVNISANKPVAYLSNNSHAGRIAEGTEALNALKTFTEVHKAILSAEISFYRVSDGTQATPEELKYLSTALNFLASENELIDLNSTTFEMSGIEFYCNFKQIR